MSGGDQEGGGHSIFSSEVRKAIESGSAVESDEDAPSAVETPAEILTDYATGVDPALADAGWHLAPAKSTEFGYADSSMLSHARNAVFGLLRFNEILDVIGGRGLRPDELREAVALTVVHDLHKLTDSDHWTDEFDISQDRIASLVEEVGLDEFAPGLSVDTYHACVVDHHDSPAANPEAWTPKWEDLRPYVRFADGLASCETPEEAASSRLQETLNTIPQTEAALHAHRLDDVKGILTNLINRAVAERSRRTRGHHLLAIYQDGCVYISSLGDESPVADHPPATDSRRELIADVVDRVQETIPDAHPAYNDPARAANRLQSLPKGYYSIDDSDFFYAGADSMLRAAIHRSLSDVDHDDEASDSQVKTIEYVNEKFPVNLPATDVTYNASRLVYTVASEFLDPLLDAAGEDSPNKLEIVCDLFGADSGLKQALVNAPSDVDEKLRSGGTWKYAYPIAEAFLHEYEGFGDPSVPGIDIENEIYSDMAEGLAALDSEWVTTIADQRAGELRDEMLAYVDNILRFEGIEATNIREGTSDQYEQYTRRSRARLCSVCNRGTAGRSIPEAKKGLTTLQGGYSRFVEASSGKKEKRPTCRPCQIEYALRETAADRRNPDDDRLFIHVVPTYFYTPFSWRLYGDLVGRLSGDSRVRINQVAEATFDVGRGGTGGVADAIGRVMRNLRHQPGSDDKGDGVPMLESVERGFSPEAQFGALTVAYSKPKENDAEFQFFGAFVALAVAAYTGSRIYISDSPIPEERGRDFDAHAKLGAGFSSVAKFYGDEVPLSRFANRLGVASALILLGRRLQEQKFDDDNQSPYNDSLFKKYLRITRNHRYPGSHLLKRAATNADGNEGGVSAGSVAAQLHEYAMHLDSSAHETVGDDSRSPHNPAMHEANHDRDSGTDAETEDPITRLAWLGFQVLRPTNDRPHTVERAFRDAVKAIKSLPEETGRAGYVNAVAGRIQKIPDRTDLVYPVGYEDAEIEGVLEERARTYAEFFVDEILYGMFNGRPSELKRRSNDLADAFYAATLALRRESFENGGNDDSTDAE